MREHEPAASPAAAGLWPLVKRLHRAATAARSGVPAYVAAVGPARAADPGHLSRSVDTAARDPEHVTLHHGRAGRDAGPGDAGGRAGRSCGVRAVAAPYGLGALRARRARRAAGRRLRRDGRADPGGRSSTTRPAATSGSRAGASTRCSCAPGCPSRGRCRGRCCRWPPAGRARTTTTSSPTCCPAGGSSRRRCPAPRWTRVYLGTRASYQRQLLELAGLSGLPVVEVDKHACLAPERLLVPSTPNQDLMAPHWVVDWLRAPPARRRPT